MTNQPPLNPDALEDAADVIWMRAHGEHGVCRADRERGSYRIAVDAAEEAISAYLAVAQPVVNSVEELDALPHGSVILNSLEEAVSKYGDDWYFPGIKHRFATVASLPARVLYRPEVKP